MLDQELADSVIALGVGNNTHDLYAIGAYHVIGCTASDFVRDWRVAGALIERCKDDSGNYWFGVLWDQAAIEFTDEPLPRAIIEACMESRINA